MKRKIRKYVKLNKNKDKRKTNILISFISGIDKSK